jgi:hypothetical protein
MRDTPPAGGLQRSVSSRGSAHIIGVDRMKVRAETAPDTVGSSKLQGMSPSGPQTATTQL